MPGDGNDECYLLTCNSWALVVGELLALAYIRIMFGVDHVAGQPPKYCAFNIEPRSLPLRMVQGSLYVWDYRIHHWLFYLLLLPLFVGLQFYVGIGFSGCMIIHGLWYDDRFEFKYQAHKEQQQVPSEETFQLHYTEDEVVDAGDHSKPEYNRPPASVL